MGRANESEAFGEDVKEGEGPETIRDYLDELSKVCRSLDQGQKSENTTMISPLAASRSSMTTRFPSLAAAFLRATSIESAEAGGESFVVVYDNEANQLNKVLKYSELERGAAAQEYRQICARVDESRYETLLLNSDSVDALRVSHPRLFPETA